MHDPLRRGVHPCAIIILPAGTAVTAGEESARSKVNQLDLQSVPVNEDVFILDIPMDNPSFMTTQNCFDCLKNRILTCNVKKICYLVKYLLGSFLPMNSSLRYLIKQVSRVGRFLHHKDEAVLLLKPVKQFYYPESGNYISFDSYI